MSNIQGLDSEQEEAYRSAAVSLVRSGVALTEWLDQKAGGGIHGDGYLENAIQVSINALKATGWSPKATGLPSGRDVK